MQVFLSMLHKIYYIDSLVDQFFTNFNTHYADALATDFDSLSLPEQVDYIKHLYKVCRCQGNKNVIKVIQTRSRSIEA